MSLVAGRGPLSRDRAGQLFPPVADDLVYVEPHPRRVQAVLGGRTVIDTEHALMVHRRGAPLSYAFSAGDIGDLPSTPVPEAPGYAVVPWSAVDSWFEEGRELVHYPPNPYHRVDCRPTARRLRVDAGEVTLVDTTDTTILFETALPPRLYVRPSAVRTDLLRRSSTTSYCNYKGLRDVLEPGHRRHGGRRRRVELRRPPTREPAHRRHGQLRRDPGGRDR